jgi:hypothetical protein
MARTLRLLGDDVAAIAQALTASPSPSPSPSTAPPAEVAPVTPVPPVSDAIVMAPPATAKKVRASKSKPETKPAKPKSEPKRKPRPESTPPATDGEIVPTPDTTIHERLLANLNDTLQQLVAAELGETAMQTIRQHASDGDVNKLDAPRLLRLTVELSRLLPETESASPAVDKAEALQREQLLAAAQALTAELVKNERGTVALVVMQKHVAGTGRQVVDLATPNLEALVADLRIATTSG